MGSAQVVAIKGVEGFNRAAPVVGPKYVDATEGGRKIRRGARLWTIAVATFKSETYRFLRLSPPIEDAAPWPAGCGGVGGSAHSA
jgi:phage terminase large subunit GpA-like protein